MWFEKNRDKDHGDMIQNPICVTIPQSIFMNKKLSFHTYQENHLKQSAENQCVDGVIIVENPCSSTEESEYKPLSYDWKANYV